MLLFQGRSGQIFLLLLLFRLTAAVEDFGHFTDPPDGSPQLIYTLGSIIQVTWATVPEKGLERVALTLFHVGGPDLEYLPNSRNITNEGVYPWVVGQVVDADTYPTPVTQEVGISDRLYQFVIFKPGNTTGAIKSNTFNIVSGSSSSTSATTSSSSTSSSSTSTSSFVTSTSSASPVITSVISSPTATATSSGLNQSAKTGIGVGIGLGIPLLFALGICLGWRFRGGRNTSDSSRATTDDTPFTAVSPNFSRPVPHDHFTMDQFPNPHHPMNQGMSDHMTTQGMSDHMTTQGMSDHTTQEMSDQGFVLPRH